MRPTSSKPSSKKPLPPRPPESHHVLNHARQTTYLESREPIHLRYHPKNGDNGCLRILRVGYALAIRREFGSWIRAVREALGKPPPDERC